jgi:NAD(P)-dependent dehydrogenase (short-subunit alcohol dehydrogenase family)
VTALADAGTLLRLDGRSAIVTGGGSGIGLQTVIRLAQAGARVHAVEVSRSAIDSARAALDGLGTSVCWHEADVADPGAAADTCRCAGDSLHVLVNNAGVYPQQPLLEADVELWDRLARTNVVGALNYLTPVAQRLVALGSGGSIVNVASVAALRATTGFAHYGATKAALIALTQSSAYELGAFKVRVNAVAPGGIVTDGYVAAAARSHAGSVHRNEDQRRPLRTLGSPDDVARAVLYLASPMSEYVTGTTLVVDGGVTL